MKTRYILLYDGLGMDGQAIKVETNAKIEELKQLEEDNDGTIWADYCKEKGYIFNIIEARKNMSPYGTSRGVFTDIDEAYVLE